MLNGNKIIIVKKTIKNQSLFESIFRLAEKFTKNKSQSFERKEIQLILNSYIDKE